MTFYDRKLVRMTAVTPKGDDVKLQLLEIIRTCFEAETEGELVNVSSSGGAKFRVSIGD